MNLPKMDNRITVNLTAAGQAAMLRCAGRRDGNKTDAVDDALKFLDRVETEHGENQLPFGFMREDGIFVEVWLL
jgi:hypothetical protein